jgi:hypothetical protein
MNQPDLKDIENEPEIMDVGYQSDESFEHDIEEDKSDNSSDVKPDDDSAIGCIKSNKQSYLLKILQENRVTRANIREYISILNQRILELQTKLSELKTSGSHTDVSPALPTQTTNRLSKLLGSDKFQ